MKVIKYNISKPEKYTAKGGAEKTKWNNIGELVEFYKDDGSVGRIIKIPCISLEANVFPIVPKDQGPRQYDDNQQSAPEEHGVDTTGIPY